MSVPLAPASADALGAANHEAKRLGSGRLEPAHVLLGLRALDPWLAPALRSCGGPVDRGALRLQVEYLTRDASRGLRRDVLPPSAATRRLMIDAASEARRWGHQAVAVEHVLAALLRDDDAAVAVQAVRRCGVDVAACRAALAAALGTWFEPPAPVDAIPTGQPEGVLAYASPRPPVESAAPARPPLWELAAAAATFAGILAAAGIAVWGVVRL